MKQFLRAAAPVWPDCEQHATLADVIILVDDAGNGQYTAHIENSRDQSTARCQRCTACCLHVVHACVKRQLRHATVPHGRVWDMSARKAPFTQDDPTQSPQCARRPRYVKLCLSEVSTATWAVA